MSEGREEFKDWRGLIAELTSLLRDRDALRVEVAALAVEAEAAREEARDQRERADELHTTVAAYVARGRAANMGVLGDSFQDLDVDFGTSTEDAVPLPRDANKALFLFGLIETLTTNNRPVYFRVERKPPADRAPAASAVPPSGGRG